MLTATTPDLRKGSTQSLVSALNNGTSESAEDLPQVIAELARIEGLPSGIVRDAFSLLQNRVKTLGLPNAIRTMNQCLKLETGLNRNFLDFLPHLLNYIAEAPKIKTVGEEEEFSSPTVFSGQEVASAFVHKIITIFKQFDLLLNLILALKELSFPFLPQSFSLLLKMIEEGPIRDIPSILYQVLLMCHQNNMKTSSDVFDTVFAVLEAKKGSLNIGECMESIRLAFSLNQTLGEAFVKYAKSTLKGSQEPSPQLFLLLCQERSDGSSVQVLERYLITQTQRNRMLASFNNLPGLPSGKNLSHFLTKIISAVDGHDGSSLEALIVLSWRLTSYKSSIEEDTKVLNSLGGEAFRTISSKFPVALDEIIKILVEKLFQERAMGSEVAHWNKSVVALLADIAKANTECFKDSLLSLEDELFDALLESFTGYPELCHDLLISTMISEPSISDRILKHVRQTPHLFSLYFGIASKSSSASLNLLMRMDALIRSKHLPCILLWINEHQSSLLGLGSSDALFRLLFWHLKSYFPTGKCTDWKWIAASVDFSPEILQTLIYVRRQSRCPEAAEFKDIMDNLSELLCHPITWFTAEMMEEDAKGKLEVISHIIELYLVTINHVLDCEDLSLTAAIEASTKIAAELDAFQSSLTVQLAIGTPVSGQTLTRVLEYSLRSRVSESLLLAVLRYSKKNCIQESKTLVSAALKIVSPDNEFIHRKRLFHEVIPHFLLATGLQIHLDIMLQILGKVLEGDFPNRDKCAFLESLHATMRIESVSDRNVNVFKRLVKAWTCSHDSETSIAKALLAILVEIDPISDQLLPVLCDDNCTVAGRLIPDADEAQRPQRTNQVLKTTWPLITSKSKEHVATVIFAFLREAMGKINWLYEIATEIVKSSKINTEAILSYIWNEMGWICKSLAILCQSKVSGSNFTKLIDLLQNAFRLAQNCCKLMAAARIVPQKSALTVAAFMAEELTVNIYEMLPIVQQEEIERIKENLYLKKSKSKSKSSAAKSLRTTISKENRLIPTLIFAIEGWERAILKCNEVFKVKMVKCFHRSTSRDFRIQVEELTLLEESAQASDTDSGNDTDDESDPASDTNRMQIDDESLLVSAPTLI